MRFVDANVFIYVLVRSPKKDYDVARGILEGIEKGEQAVTSVAVIQEVVDWLEYNGRKKEVRTFLSAVNSYLSMEKRGVEWSHFMPAMEDMDKHKIDFVDALTLQIMKECGVEEIYSNDKDFERVDWAKRIWE
jgi:predicted nucleic acid-binding protein